jgi:hypothetical protein
VAGIKAGIETVAWTVFAVTQMIALIWLTYSWLARGTAGLDHSC